MSKIGSIYYTTNELDPAIMQPCQRQLRKSFDGEIVAVSLKPLDFGDKRIVLDLEPCYLTMFKQILAGLEASESEICFLTEHDILYPKDHFSFIPPREDKYYYNLNNWWIRYSDGHALYLNNRKQVSGLCAYREQLIKHYKERIRRVELEGFTRKNGFEPGTRHISHGGYDDNGFDTWISKSPLIDIRHDSNLSNRTDNPKYRARWHDWRWKKKDYKNKKYIEGWTEGDESIIPRWNIPKGGFKQFLSLI